jgi:hypothetical protein
MILFDESVEKVVGLVKTIMTKGFADGAWGGVVPVRYDPLWSMTHRFAASMFRFWLTIEATRFPSRSMARYR